MSLSSQFKNKEREIECLKLYYQLICIYIVPKVEDGKENAENT